MCRGRVILADTVSQNNLDALSSKIPGGSNLPRCHSEDLTKLLMEELPDWTSLSWSQLQLFMIFSAGIAKATQRIYKTESKWYSDFCENFGLIPFPASESVLMYFVAFHRRKGCWLEQLRVICWRPDMCRPWEPKYSGNVTVRVFEKGIKAESNFNLLR